VCLRVNSSVALLGSDARRGFTKSHGPLRVVDSLPLEEFLRSATFILYDLHWGRFHNELRERSLLSFVNSDSFRDSSNTLLVLRLQPLPGSDEGFWSLCIHARNSFDFPLLRLATETRIRPALTCTARITRLNSEQSEHDGSTV
jgi:hypothetical protein